MQIVDAEPRAPAAIAAIYDAEVATSPATFDLERAADRALGGRPRGGRPDAGHFCSSRSTTTGRCAGYAKSGPLSRPRRLRHDLRDLDLRRRARARQGRRPGALRAADRAARGEPGAARGRRDDRAEPGERAPCTSRSGSRPVGTFEGVGVKFGRALGRHLVPALLDPLTVTAQRPQRTSHRQRPPAPAAVGPAAARQALAVDLHRDAAGTDRFRPANAASTS